MIVAFACRRANLAAHVLTTLGNAALETLHLHASVAHSAWAASALLLSAG